MLRSHGRRIVSTMSENTPSTPEAIILRLKWRQTWPEKESDFICEVTDYQGSVGRIYLFDTGPQQGSWFWAMQAHGDDVSRNIGKLSGVEPSAREAAREVERAWFAAIRGSSYELSDVAPQPEAARNAYAAAKGR